MVIKQVKHIILGSSVRGYSHKKSNIECQDSYLKLEIDDAVIIAVADGHGSSSCPYSKTGSTIAVNSFCEILKELYIKNKDNLDFFLSFLNREGDTKIAQSIDLEWKNRVLNVHRHNKRATSKVDKIHINKAEIYKLYGTTLIGTLITPQFYFSLQIGDGDIVSVSNNGVKRILDTDKILGIETHSLSKVDSWKNAKTMVGKIDSCNLPQLFMLSTDGFSNSFRNEEEYHKTCADYFSMTNQYGVKAIETNLKEWLSETSEKGCGDDITLLMCYFFE